MPESAEERVRVRAPAGFDSRAEAAGPHETPAAVPGEANGSNGLESGTASALAAQWRIPWLRGELPEAEHEPRVLSRDALYRRSLALADVVAGGVAVVTAVTVLGQDRLVAGVLLAIPLIVLVSEIVVLYDRVEDFLRNNAL